MLQARPVPFLISEQVEGYEIRHGAGATEIGAGIGKDSGSRH